MKTERYISISLMITAVFSLCFGHPARADEAADRTALHMIRTNYMEAVNSGDLTKMSPYIGTDATGVMVTGEEVKGFDGLKAYWAKIQNLIGPDGSYHVTVNLDKTDLYHDDFAVARGSTDDTVHLGNGKDLHFNSLWTAICHKEDGNWKVIRMEAAMDPVDNVFVSLQLAKAKLLFGTVGVAAGAAFGLIIGILISRKRSRSLVTG
jgi:ketosteroid isomerase-like protein